MRDNIFLQSLRNEIDNDPKELGYTGKDSQEIADLLNAVGGSSDELNNDPLDAYKIVNVLDLGDLRALDSTDISILNLMVSAGIVDISNANVQSLFGTIFAGKDTLTALNVLAKRSVSRADFLGFSEISFDQVERAQLDIFQPQEL